MERRPTTIKYKAEVKVLKFNVNTDDRGSLIAIEKNKDVPFDIKRVYFIFDTKPNMERGKHAHKVLQQMLVCLNGRCKVRVDDGKVKESFLLDTPNIGLYINGLIWREMYDFSPDCVLMVLADSQYSEEDYIRNYASFIKLADRRHYEQ